MPGEALGTGAAVAAAVEEAGALLPLRDAEQLELIRGPDDKIERHLVPAAPRGRGRPKNARNKRTMELRAYLLSRYAHPLEVLAQIYSRPTDALAAELGCKPVEALAIQKSAAAELAPYVEGKMPVAIDLTARGDFSLVIEGLTHSADEVEELRTITFRQSEIVEAEFEENQELSDDEGSASE